MFATAPKVYRRKFGRDRAVADRSPDGAVRGAYARLRRAMAQSGSASRCGTAVPGLRYRPKTGDSSIRATIRRGRDASPRRAAWRLFLFVPEPQDGAMTPGRHSITSEP